MAVAFAVAPNVGANPVGGRVVVGNVTIAGSGGTLTLTQTSERAIVNWEDFSIGAGELTKFLQPSTTSAVLNRVVSALPSSLDGALEANGRVYLINPNGVLIGGGARIDAGGFLASTLDVTNEEFLAGGDLRFTGSSTAAIQNLGAINALGGDVFLIARQVRNDGTIAASGTAGLAAGSEILLTTGSGERFFVHAGSAGGSIDNTGTISAASAELKAAGGNAYALAINNAGTVRAIGLGLRGGELWLVASGESTVANAGTLDASSAVGKGGTVVVSGGRVLLDDGAKLQAAGANGGGEIFIGGGWQGQDAAIANASAVVLQPGAAIDARATDSGKGGSVVLWSQDYTGFFGRITAQGGERGGDGGAVETSSHGVLQAAGAVDTRAANGLPGSWLLDPWNVTIADTGASGTTFADTFAPTTDSVILASSINTALDGGADVTITTGTTGSSGGSINVDAPITWSADSTLTLSAYIDVRVNSPITATGAAAGLVITPNNPSNIYGGTFSINNRASITLSGANPSLTIAGLSYTVINSLGIEGDATIAPGTPTLQGLAALANLGGRFALGSDIDAIDTANWNSFAGFAPIGTEADPFVGTLEGLGHTITGLSITQPAGVNVGLFGYLGASGLVRDVGVVDAGIVGKTSVGGIVGYNGGGVIRSYSTGYVTGVGGHFATSDRIGGIAGTNANAITASYSSASVSGTENVGGLVGYNDTAWLTESYATGDVMGQTSVGGLVGYSTAYFSIESLSTLQDVYATGNVSGTDNVGGIVGYNHDTDLIRAYATGSVSGTTNVGGLAGVNQKSKPSPQGIQGSYWNTETTGQAAAVGLENGDTQFSFGRTSVEMMEMASFPEFNITDTGGVTGPIWRIYEGFTTPWLTVFLFPVTVTANSATKTYDATAYAGGNGVTYSLPTLNPALSGTLAYAGSAQGAVNAGSYSLAPGGLYSVQQGYDVIYAPGTLTINKADLALSGTRVYDGSTIFAGSNLTATGVAGQTFAVSGAGAVGNLGTKNVQTNQALASVGGLTLGTSGNGGLAGNYNALSTANSSVSVTPAALSIAGFASNDKVYDGDTAAVIATPGTLSGVVLGDTVGFTYTAASFDTKNVGTDKTVTLNGVTLTGSGDEANYTYTAVTTDLSDITPATLTYTADLASRTYGASDPAFTGTITGFANGENQVNATSGTAVFASTATVTSNVGTYAINGSGLTANDGNYLFVQAAGNATALTIDPANLVLSGTRSYDGTTIFAGNLLAATGVNGETFTVTGAGAPGNLSTRNVQSGQLLASVGGLALGTSSNGGLAGNYNALSVAGSSVTVTPASVTASSSDVVKTYDGNTSAAGSPVVTMGALFGGDVLAGGAFAYTNKDAGLGNKTVTVSGITVNDGNGGNNYAVMLADNTTSTINKAALTLSGTRIYDGTTIFAGNLLTATGVNGEAFAVTGAGAAGNLSTKDVQSGQLLASVAGLSVGAGNSGAALETNYDGLSVVNSSVSVTARPLTITADDKTKVYGAVDPLLTATYDGLVATDDAGDVTGLLLAAPTGALATAGAHTISASGATALNYVITLVDGELIVDKAPVIVMADAKTKAYGDADPTLTFSVGPLQYADTAADVLSGALTRVAGETVAASPYAIGAGTLAANSNYTIDYTGADLVITPRPITLVPNAVTKIYGAEDPGLSVAITGGSLGSATVSDTLVDVTGTLSRQEGANVGLYDVQLGTGAKASNYAITFDVDNDAFEITPATLTYVANAASRLVGESDPPFSGTVTGFVSGDSLGSATTGTLEFDTTATSESPVGVYPIYGSGLAANHGNYVFVQAPPNATAFTIGEASVPLLVPLTITADDKTKIYGASLPVFTATFDGFVDGDTVSSVTGLQFSTTATIGSNIGSFAITPFGATAPEYYSVSYVPGTLTISPAALTIVANDATRVFGASNPVFSATLAGLVNGDQASVVNGLVLETSATATSTVGNYAITPSSAVAANYTITYLPGTLLVVAPSVPVGGADVPVLVVDDQPAISGDFAVVVMGERSVLVSLDRENDGETSVSERLDQTLTELGGALPTAGEENFGSFLTRLDEMGFEVLATAGGEDGDFGGMTPEQLAASGAIRESALNRGKFNVVYRELIQEARAIAGDNLASHSSYDVFFDSDKPQVVVVRAAGKSQGPGDTPDGRSPLNRTSLLVPDGRGTSGSRG